MPKSRKKRKKVTVWALSDGVMIVETWKGRTVNAKIHDDGRGYVKTNKAHVIYARVEKMIIEPRAGL